jgi:hypothetical protein
MLFWRRPSRWCDDLTVYRKRLYGFVVAAAALAALAVMFTVFSSARLLAVILGACTILAALYPLLESISSRWSPPEWNEEDYETAVSNLRNSISKREAREWLLLLDRAEEPARTRLKAATSLYSYRSGAAPPDCAWNESFSFFWNLRPRRLLVLGEGGAGKTLLLLELIRQANVSKLPNIPILIRLNVANWRDGESFKTFLVKQISSVHGIAESVAYAIYDRRQLVPLLDGLDELDSEGSDPVRGYKIIERLNSVSEASYPIDWPLVITCRTKYFENLETMQRQRHSSIVGLQGTAAYVLTSLSKEQILSYLSANLVPDAQRRWIPVTEALSNNDSHILGVLGSPWRLMLAFRSFAHSGRPGELLLGGGNVEEIERRLMPQFFAAVFERQSQRRSAVHGRFAGIRFRTRAFDDKPDRVAHWLKQIAIHLGAGQKPGEAAGQIFIYKIYQMAPKRWQTLIFVSALLTGSCAVLFFVALAAIEGAHPPLRIIAIAFTVIFMLVSFYNNVGSEGSASGIPIGATLTDDLRTWTDVMDLIVSMLAALAVGAFTVGAGDSFILRILGGAICGLIGGISFGFIQAALRRSRGVGLLEARSPLDPMRSRLGTSSIMGLIFAILYFVTLILFGTAVRMAIIFAVCALVTFILYGLPILSIPWLQYRSALTILFLQRRLPWRLRTFLQWNHEAGLTRATGLAYQFRHIRLQQWIGITGESDLLPPRLKNVRNHTQMPRELYRTCIPLPSLLAGRAV